MLVITVCLCVLVRTGNLLWTVGIDKIYMCVCVSSSEDEAAVVMMIRKRKGKAVLMRDNCSVF